MRRIFGIPIILMLLLFALPPFVHALESILIPAIIVTLLISIGMLLFQRRRRWLYVRSPSANHGARILHWN